MCLIPNIRYAYYNSILHGNLETFNYINNKFKFKINLNKLVFYINCLWVGYFDDDNYEYTYKEHERLCEIIKSLFIKYPEIISGIYPKLL